METVIFDKSVDTKSATAITETETYLTFTLDDEAFAVSVSNVREVLDFTTVTKVPRTPDFMRGVINLRGSVVPVMDMRLKFGMPRTEDTVDTCIVVMEVTFDDEITIIGALADSVKEVFELDPFNIDPPPRIGTHLDTEFIKGMGKRDDKFIIILNIENVFSSGELTIAKELEQGMNPALAEQAAKTQEEPTQEKARTAKKEETEPAEEGMTGPEIKEKTETSVKKSAKTKRGISTRGGRKKGNAGKKAQAAQKDS